MIDKREKWVDDPDGPPSMRKRLRVIQSQIVDATPDLIERLQEIAQSPQTSPRDRNRALATLVQVMAKLVPNTAVEDAYAAERPKDEARTIRWEEAEK